MFPGADQLRATAQMLIRHPKFPLARAAYARATQAMYRTSRVANVLINEAARSVIANACLYFDLTFDPDDPTSGLSMRKIQRVCTERGEASAGRVFAFVKMLQLSGFLVSVPAADRRYKFLRPTEKLQAHRTELMQTLLCGLDDLVPGAGYVARLTDPAVDRAVLRVSGADYFAGFMLPDLEPNIAFFVARDGGFHFLLTLLDAAGHIEGHSATPIDLPLADLARRLQLSRSHLRMILGEAAERSLVTLARDGGSRIEVTPRLITAFDTFVALVLAYYQDIIDHRLQETPPFRN